MRRYRRRIFMIFCLILLVTMPMGMTVSAQKTDGGFVLTLQELSSQCRGSVKYQIEGDIPIPLSNETDLEKYFGEVIAVRYVDARTVRLHTKGFVSPNIRIEVDKGRLRLKHVLAKGAMGSSGKRYVTVDGAKKVPISIVGLAVDSLDKNDKDLTVRVYLDKSNKVLGEKSYQLNLGKVDLDSDLTMQELFSICRGCVVEYQIGKDVSIPLSDRVEFMNYFREVVSVKYVDARTVRLKTKNVSNPTIRIEVDRGRLGLKHVLGKDVEETSQRVTRYVTKDGAQSGYVAVVGLTVDSLDKSDKCLTIRTYNDESNEILGEKSYRLSLERVNLETSCFLAVRYYDKRGNYNQYKGDLGEWITDADWDRPVMVVAVDDCGNTYEVDWFEITTPNSFDGLRLTVKGDTMPLEFCERMKNAQPGSRVKSLWLTTNSQVRLNDGKTHPLLGISFRVYKSAK